VCLQDDAGDERGVPSSSYILWEAGLQVGLRESISRVRLGVLYTDSDMCSFLTEYYPSVVLALHANRCRAAQVE
jgi:hypothetical protein